MQTSSYQIVPKTRKWAGYIGFDGQNNSECFGNMGLADIDTKFAFDF